MKDQSKKKQTLIKKKVSLDETSEYAENIINTVREPLIILDQDLRVVTASRSFYEFFKVKPEETEGQLIYNLGNDQWDIPSLRELLETILPQKTTFDNYEVEHNFTSIGKRIMLLNARQIKRALGKERLILLAIEDITERKQLETLLIDSEERYRHLFETASDGIVFLEQSEGRITHANPSCEQMLGYTKKELIGNKLQDIGVSLDMGDFQTTMQHLNRNGFINYNDVPVKTRSGQQMDTDIYLVDRAILVQCSIRDMTERKKQEDELLLANTLLNSIIENIPDMIFLKDSKEFRFVRFNQAGEDLLGYSREDLLGKSDYDFFPKEQADLFTKNDREVLSGMKVVDIPEENIQTRNRGKRILHTKKVPLLNAKGEPEYLLGISEDITERKQTEETLRNSEEKYRLIFENAPLGLISFDENGVIIDCNDNFVKIIGSSREKLIGLSMLSLPDKNIVSAVKRALKGSPGFYEGEYSSVTAKKITPVRCLFTPMNFGGGRIPGGAGIIEDITERKRRDEQLRESEELFRHLFQHHAAMKFIIDPDTGDILDANEAAVTYYGWSREELTHMKIQEINTLQPAEVKAVMDKARTGKRTNFEFRHRRADGSIRDVQAFSSSIKVKGKDILHSIIIDVTEHKRAERALQKSEERFRRISSTISDINYSCSTKEDGLLSIDWMIGATEHISGYSIEEIKAQKCWRFLVIEEDLALFEKNVTDLAPGSQGFCELRIRHKNGGIIWVASYAECFIDKETPGYFILYGALVDITEHKQVDARLLESEERYRSVVENSQEGIFQTTPKGRFRMANQATARILGYDSPRELIESVTDITHQIYVNPEDRIKNLANLDLHGMDLNIELQFYRKDGSVIWVSAQTQSVRDKNGNVICYEGMIQDITDRKNNAEKVKKALGGTVQAIASLAESRDPYTAGHQQRVAGLAAAIAEEMGLSPEQIEGLTMGCIIHDIGKVSVPADILNMPRKLTVIEFGLVKAHVQSGHDIVKDIEFPWPVARMILEHHERIDGSGYPNGLTGDKLLLESRIMEVADVVEAMASHRPYRTALGIDAALEEIEKNKGIIYDADVADACLKLFREKGYQLK